MNYYKAKQRLKDKRWDYTRNNYPAGYCCEYREIDPTVIPISESEQKRYQATAHKHHTDGHETEEEACECYQEYLLDHSLRFGKMSDQQLKCKVCDEWTQEFADIDCHMIVLCPKHQGRETVKQLFKVGESWSSW